MPDYTDSCQSDRVLGAGRKVLLGRAQGAEQAEQAESPAGRGSMIASRGAQGRGATRPTCGSGAEPTAGGDKHVPFFPRCVCAAAIFLVRVFLSSPPRRIPFHAARGIGPAACQHAASALDAARRAPPSPR